MSFYVKCDKNANKYTGFVFPKICFEWCCIIIFWSQNVLQNFESYASYMIFFFDIFCVCIMTYMKLALLLQNMHFLKIF